METQEEAMASHSSSSADDATRPLVIKRTRTRRHRATPPPPAAASSPASSLDDSAFTNEEDMANCLILLAQGGGVSPAASAKFTSKKFTATSTTIGGPAGFYVYECKTCNKCFPSFQALGGHRASHKKLKIAAAAAAAGEKKGVFDEVHLKISMNTLSKRVDSVGKGKVHECLICRSEFSSGQALGGHMRRHRPAVEIPDELKKEKNVLSLDLNLPAPPEDDSSFAIPGNPLVFAPPPPPLVDCNY